MIKTTKTPVFFIATRAKKEPVKVSFFTKTGKPVAFDTVERVKTKEGVHFYVKTQTSKKQ